MTTYLGKSCSFCLPRVPFVNCRQFMYLVISLLVLRAGCGIWLYQFLIIAYLFTLLHSTQSGFRPNHSCETSQMINKWLGAINNSEMIGMVKIDFRKAFDLVDHTLLLKKLKYYKISEETISWFSSYLLGRKQKVFVNNTLSEAENVICVVLQGSILGPLLFLIFINDLPLNIDNVLTDLYADDTALYYTDESQACIEQQLQTALHKLSEWCKMECW